MNCPGSPSLIAPLPPGADDADPEYRVAGTAAHAAAAECLRQGIDAWEGPLEIEGYRLTAEDLRAIQTYLDVARARIAEMRAEAKASVVVWIEQEIRAPEIHELAFGTLDLALVAGDYAQVIDYKHGEGIWVEAEGNGQIMGYACLLLSKFPFIKRFGLGIVQPRCDPYDGPRWTEITADELRQWRDTTLIPAMNAAAPRDYIKDGELCSGSWCRFCAAKEALACPALIRDASTFQAVAPLAERLPDDTLGDLYQKIEPMKIMAKAIEAEVLRRRLAGIDVPGSKTVAKKTFRVWKDTAKEAIVAALGGAALTTPKLKGPADIEKLGARGKELVKEFAYSPDAGYSVATLSDRRKAVTPPVQSAATFDNFVVDNRGESE